MKKSKSASQFPNIYRIITEKPVFKKIKKNRFGLVWQSKSNKPLALASAVFIFFVVLLLCFGIAVYGIKIYRYSLLARQISRQRQNLQNNVDFWRSVADKYGGYKDAYFQMALLEYRLGNFQKAKEDNQKALLLDPNFGDAKRLESVLDKKTQ